MVRLRKELDGVVWSEYSPNLQLSILPGDTKLLVSSCRRLSQPKVQLGDHDSVPSTLLQQEASYSIMDTVNGEDYFKLQEGQAIGTRRRNWR
jgi:hypothetical protein